LPQGFEYPCRKDLNILVARNLLGCGGILLWQRPPDSNMARRFKVGDHVSWNSEAGRVRGRIIKVHTKDVNYKGYVRHASKEEPQYEIKSDKTDHVAMHKGTALRLLRR
jgi:hypothetical protein